MQNGIEPRGATIRAISSFLIRQIYPELGFDDKNFFEAVEAVIADVKKIWRFPLTKDEGELLC